MFFESLKIDFDIKMAGGLRGPPWVKLDLRRVIPSGSPADITINISSSYPTGIVEGAEKLLDKLIEYEEQGILELR